MADRLILCSGCGTKNRISPSGSGQPKCGACGKALAVPGYSHGGLGLSKTLLAWLVVGGLVVGGYLWKEGSNDSRSRTTSNDQNSPNGETGTYYVTASTLNVRLGPTQNGRITNKLRRQQQVDVLEVKNGWARISKYYDGSVEGLSGTVARWVALSHLSRSRPNAVPVPVSAGVMQWPSNPGVAPLGIKTRSGHDYYVKLVDLAGRTVMTMYLEGGRYFETTAPLGTFEMRYAFGKTWYGAKHHFGPETSYAKADSLFDFTFDGSQYSGYTVELVVQPGGNLSTSPLSPASF